MKDETAKLLQGLYGLRQESDHYRQVTGGVLAPHTEKTWALESARQYGVLQAINYAREYTRDRETKP